MKAYIVVYIGWHCGLEHRFQYFGRHHSEQFAHALRGQVRSVRIDEVDV